MFFRLGVNCSIKSRVRRGWASSLGIRPTLQPHRLGVRFFSKMRFVLQPHRLGVSPPTGASDAQPGGRREPRRC
jgi:hypothetical protein